MAQLNIGSMQMLLNRKPIKNLHISVLPPDGKIRISAPEHMTDTAIRMAVISRIPWIKKQQADFLNQPRQSEREMISGETHYLWGQRYRLDVIPTHGRHVVKPAGGHKLQLYVQPGTTTENRAQVLNAFYRSHLKQRIESLVEYWLPIVGVTPTAWGVKKMKTRWGSCNTDARRIWLNLELAKKPPECLEYILVHELVHLLERKHNERFKGYMERFLPDWRERRDLLNQSPLGFDKWGY